MAEICSTGVVGEISGDDSSGRAARRRRMELRRVRLEPDGVKRRRLDLGDCDGICGTDQSERQLASPNIVGGDKPPKFGIASVCGRRRDMEDAVAVHPSFCERSEHEITSPALHYFGVYDGHGCSHVATKCKERLHQMVKEELRVVDDDDDKDDVVSEGRMNTRDVEWWKCVMGRSFTRMDKEAVAICNRNDDDGVAADDRVATCRCELQTPEREAVGSTAVIAVVTPDKIVVANCGDSRAVLCRNGKAVPLSTDHKPDRPDELSRIEAADGRVIYWQGARVLGVLAMSRAIGDNYLKPYVSCEPEVTMTDRTEEDECLILASDGLWDVVSEDTACGIALMCLKGGTTAAPPPPPPPLPSPESESSDKACNNASMLLTKLALARRSSDNVTVVVVDLTTKPS